MVSLAALKKKSKVFCFFFSKKKCFLLPDYTGGAALRTKANS